MDLEAQVGTYLARRWTRMGPNERRLWYNDVKGNYGVHGTREPDGRFRLLIDSDNWQQGRMAFGTTREEAAAEAIEILEPLARLGDVALLALPTDFPPGDIDPEDLPGTEIFDEALYDEA